MKKSILIVLCYFSIATGCIQQNHNTSINTIEESIAKLDTDSVVDELIISNKQRDSVYIVINNIQCSKDSIEYYSINYYSNSNNNLKQIVITNNLLNNLIIRDDGDTALYIPNDFLIVEKDTSHHFLSMVDVYIKPNFEAKTFSKYSKLMCIEIDSINSFFQPIWLMKKENNYIELSPVFTP